MQTDAEQLLVEFNNRARSVFFTLYNEFKQSVRSLDRLRDENVFQQLQSKYVYALKQHLERIVNELLSQQHRHQGSMPFPKTFTSAITGYTTEFAQKVRSL